MSHFKAKMHQILFPASICMSARPPVRFLSVYLFVCTPLFSDSLHSAVQDIQHLCSRKVRNENSDA